MVYILNLLLLTALVGLAYCEWLLFHLFLKLCLQLFREVGGLVQDIVFLTVKGPKYLQEIVY